MSLWFFLLVGFCASALAHASPVLYEPAASAVLDRVPTRIRIQFTERIEPKASSITVFAPDGSRVEANDGRPDPADGRVFSVGMRDAGRGSYTVSWQVVSEDDGHFTKGGFSFSVGDVADVTAHNEAPAEVVHSSTLSQAAAIGTELLGQTVFIGVLSLLAFLWRPLIRRKISDGQQAVFEDRCSTAIFSGTLLIAIGVGAFLVLKTLDLQQSRSAAFADSLKTFLTTVDGRFALYRMLFGFLFAAIFYASRRTIFGSDKITKLELALFGIVVVMIVARARVSHAAASHFLPNFSIFVNAVHLLSKELWIGLLLVLTFVMTPVLTRLGRTSFLADTLTQCSKYISIALGATGVTGAYIVWLHLKSPSYVLTTEWGTRFLVLAGFASALTLFRLYNQLIVERTLVADCESPQTGLRKDAAMSWRYSVAMEMCVGIALLFVTSQLIITTPPYPAEKFGIEKTVASQGTTIALSVHPVDQKQFLLSITDEKTGRPSSVNDLVVSLQNSEKNIGPIVAETERRFDGAFTFPRAVLSIAGMWNVDVTARRPDTYDAVASFRLDYPKEVDQSRVSGDERHWGGFESILFAAALGALLASWALYRWSDRLQIRSTGGDPRRGLSRSNVGSTAAMAAGLAALLVVSLVVWWAYDLLVKTDFQTLCQANGGNWHQAAPMRAGVTVSSSTMAGCTVPSGDYHFVDVREYSYFLNKPAAAPPEHHHH